MNCGSEEAQKEIGGKEKGISATFKTAFLTSSTKRGITTGMGAHIDRLAKKEKKRKPETLPSAMEGGLS